MAGHAGWHTDGLWLEWLADEEREAACRSDPCDSQTKGGIRCCLPAKHRVAHRGAGLIWCDPHSLPDPANHTPWLVEPLGLASP